MRIADTIAATITLLGLAAVGVGVTVVMRSHSSSAPKNTNLLPAAATAGARKAAPDEVVAAFYVFLSQRRFDGAWSLFTARLQSRDTFDHWRSGYDRTAYIAPAGVDAPQIEGQAARVAVRIRAVDWRDGQLVDAAWSGEWQLVRGDDRRWLLDDAKIVADATPTSFARVASATATPLPAPATPRSTGGSRMVIVISGIDSAASCQDSAYNARVSTLRRALNQADPAPVEIIGFSYNASYASCQSQGTRYNPEDLSPATLNSTSPEYGPLSTCYGVEAASGELKRLIVSLLRVDPAARFDIIGHSMGGMIASYFVAGGDVSLLQHLHSVVLLDAPVGGYDLRNPLSACTADQASWRDISPQSAVVRVTRDAWRAATQIQFYAVQSTPIGQAPVGVRLHRAFGYTDGTGGGVLGIFVGALICLAAPPSCPVAAFTAPIGAWTLDIVNAHQAVWFDSCTGYIIRQAFLAAAPSDARPYCQN